MGGVVKAPLCDRVADLVRHHSTWHGPESRRKVFIEKLTRPIAHRFMFDHEASLRVLDLLKTVPDVLADNLDFAIPPYTDCWVEFDWGTTRAHQPYYITQTSPISYQSGFRIFDGTAIEWIASGNTTPMMMPFIYEVPQFDSDPESMAAVVRERWSPELQSIIAERMGMSRIGLDSWTWGNAANKLNPTQLRSLRDRVAFTLGIPDTLKSGAEYDEWMIRFRTLVQATTGGISHLMAALLMLNRPKTVLKTFKPRGRTFIRGKLRAYAEYHQVSVNLDKPLAWREDLAPPRTVTGANDTTKRRHEVRGHFCHNAEARTRESKCVHQWVPCGEEVKPYWVTPDTEARNRQWKCARPGCGGKRWWRAEHVRGDATKGWAEKDYKVGAKL